MDRTTGRRISGIDHVRQSVADILTTPLGSRLERRNYGSLLPSLIDQPDNAHTRLRCYAAIASALMKWEPRLRITRVGMTAGDQPGQATVDLQGDYLGQSVSLSAALQMRGSA
ncbi:GPW/gp25 family protein [Comamonas aquatica]|uniref:GPW/gp25 family protein n=1 Tax=Comamonas aquatica TaxID=225991 RepID=UPI00244D4DAC|nr:GPW/gp25 family protein [Comamonas aquatica]MDH0200808.1 GPW/gp25 family protein [Comamonas aquatica]MDH1445680.1 GPW/gp25 family protein [Comamonas aquatica]